MGRTGITNLSITIFGDLCPHGFVVGLEVRVYLVGATTNPEA